MEKITNILLICLFAGFACPAISFAESPKSVLKKLKKKYDNVATLQADFTEVFEWAWTGEQVQRKGNLAIAEDNRFMIDTPEQLLVCDGEAIYRYNRLRDQVIIEPVAESGERLLPRRFLLKFADEFTAKEKAQVSVDGRAGIRLDLETDKPEEALLKDATIWLTAEDMVVHRLKFTDLSGNTTTYYFSKIIFDQPLDPFITSFTPPEDVELFDLR